MLVLHPNSTCDVCLDNYSSSTHSPHAIACGHVFCNSCLHSLSKKICPLCRIAFRETDVRKLHIDRPNGTSSVERTPLIAHAEPPDTSSDAIEVSHEARRFHTGIIRIVKEGSSASDLRLMIDKCHLWLKSQPHDLHEDLRVSFLLLYNLTETQRKLAVEAQSVRALRAESEELRNKLDDERDEAERKYAELQRANADEKETSMAIEKSLRDHYSQLDTEWRRHYELVLAECKRLEEELKLAKYPYNPLPEAPRPADMRYLRRSSSRAEVSVDGPSSVGETPSEKLRRLAKEEMFHLSPLPANIPPLPSAIQGFSALAEEDDDDFSPPEKPVKQQKAITYRTTSQSAIEPAGIPTGLDGPMKGADLWESGGPCSIPKGYDVPIASCSTSPPAESPAMRDRSGLSRMLDSTSKEKGLSRQFLYNDERRERERDRSPPAESQDRRRYQLHNILDSPMANTSPAPLNSYMQSMSSSDRPPTRTHSAQPPPAKTPSPPIPGSKTSSSATITPSSSVGHGNGFPSIPVRPSLNQMSHASSAAQQMERDRLRAEKERESLRAEKERESLRDREREREREKERDWVERVAADRRQTGSSNSLRDSTNAHRMGSIGKASGKAKMQAYA